MVQTQQTGKAIDRTLKFVNPLIIVLIFYHKHLAPMEPPGGSTRMFLVKLALLAGTLVNVMSIGLSVWNFVMVPKEERRV